MSFHLLCCGPRAPKQRLKRDPRSGEEIEKARDLVKLAAAIRRGDLVKPEIFALMSSPKKELGVDRYGYGVAVGMLGKRLGVPDRDVVSHGGDVGGACATFGMVRDADARYTVVILANSYIIPASRSAKL